MHTDMEVMLIQLGIKFTFEQIMKRGFAKQRKDVNTFVERCI